MKNSEFYVLREALLLQLTASWSGDGPCEYREVPRPAGAHCVVTPQGYAVAFRVLGRDFVDLGDAVNAYAIVAILRQHGVYTEPAGPNCDRRQVHIGCPEVAS